MLRSIMLTLTLLASTGAYAGAKDQAVQGEAVLTLRVDGELSIDPEGKVADYRISTKLDPQLERLVRRAVPSWRFKPILVDGKPVIASSPMRITLSAEEMKEGYKVVVDNVVFRPNTREEWEAEEASRKARPRMSVAGEAPPSMVWITSKSLRPPSYPPLLQQAGVEGMVLLTVRVHPDGTVAEVFASQSSLLNVKGSSKQLDRARLMLERNATDAAKRWTFTVKTEDASPLSAEALTVRLPVEYFMVGRGGPDKLVGQWRHEFRGPNQQAPWLPATNARKVGVSDLTGNEILAGVSPFALSDSSVIGKTL